MSEIKTEVIDVIRKEGQIEQNRIVEEVFDVEKCPCCGKIEDESKWGVQKSKVQAVLRELMKNGKISYTKDWQVIWEG